MIKRLLFLFFLGVLLTSCGAKKDFSYQKTSAKQTTAKAPNQKAANIVNYAKGYLGTRYKYGGTSKKGLDCSGLIYISFLNAGDIPLPRVSRFMAKEGSKIATRKARMGDLLFFKTEGSGRINHVGLVTGVNAGKISFIHSTTHKGVIISQLSQKYWSRAFVQVRRMF